MRFVTRALKTYYGTRPLPLESILQLHLWHRQLLRSKTNGYGGNSKHRVKPLESHMKNRLTPSNSAKLLQLAQESVNQGDVISMLEYLTECHFVDGLTRRLQSNWGTKLPPTEIEECVAQAVDSAVTAASSGRKIHNLGAWLWKSANNIAYDIWRTEYARRVSLNDGSEADFSGSIEARSTIQEQQELEESRLREAIRRARVLLPKFGRGQLRKLMSFFIDAVEERVPDLPSQSLADSLGIKENAARSLLSRGLRRLRRMSEEDNKSNVEDSFHHANHSKQEKLRNDK